MLTYTPPKNPELPRPTEKPWLLLLLTFLWLWPGIFGHDPWKPDEPQVTAVVQHMLGGGDWILPLAAGVPYLESSPLYYWVAAGFAKLFSPWLLSFHDAARLATPFFMAIALTCAGVTGRLLIGRRHGRSVVLILIGCIGLIVLGHQMNPAVAGFTGFSMAMLALTLSPQKPGLAGALLGAALAVVFLSTSLLEVSLITLAAMLLPAFSHWRHRNHLIALILALAIAIPLMMIWPQAFARKYPAEFNYWWTTFALGPLNGVGHVNLLHDLGYYPLLVLWFCWPAWPLAAWTLYRRRHDFDQPMLQLPATMFGILIIILTVSSRQSAEYALPLLLPMALLAATELDTLRRGVASLLNWFGLMTFGFFGVFIWLGWIAMNFGWPAKMAERSAYFSPYYQPQVSIAAAVCALLGCLVWGWAVTRRHLRGRQAVTNWAAGITLFCGLTMTLWLPWLDAGKSFRPVVDRMQQHMPAELRAGLKNGNACIATETGNTTARISWRYYSDIRLKTFNRGENPPCDWRLTARRKDDQWSDPAWQLIWEGHRPRDESDIFALYQRAKRVD